MAKGVICGRALYNGNPARGVYVALDHISASNELNAGRLQLYQVDSWAPAMPNSIGQAIRNLTATNDNYYLNYSVTANDRGFFIFTFRWELGGIGGAVDNLFPQFVLHAFRPMVESSVERQIMTRYVGRGVVMPTGTLYNGFAGTNDPTASLTDAASLLLDMASIRRGIGITSLPFLAPSRSIDEGLAIFGVADIRLS